MEFLPTEHLRRRAKAISKDSGTWKYYMLQSLDLDFLM